MTNNQQFPLTNKELLDKEMAEGYKAISETDIEVYLPDQAEVVGIIPTSVTTPAKLEVNIR